MYSQLSIRVKSNGRWTYIEYSEFLFLFLFSLKSPSKSIDCIQCIKHSTLSLKHPSRSSRYHSVYSSRKHAYCSSKCQIILILYLSHRISNWEFKKKMKTIDVVELINGLTKDVSLKFFANYLTSGCWFSFYRRICEMNREKNEPDN